MTNDELLTRRQTAAFLGIEKNCLDQWAFRGIGPKFIKLGPKPQSPVRYRRSDVEAWLAANTVSSTSAYSAKGGAL